jgi:hypothetical protein
VTELEPRFARTDDGGIALRLSRHEREIVRALLLELRDVLDGGRAGDATAVDETGVGDDPDRPDHAGDPLDSFDPGETDPVLRRLYPPAIPTDPAASAAFAKLVRGSLEDARRERIVAVEDTLDARALDDARAGAWLGVLNDLRLVLGTQLDVTEASEVEELEDDDPEAPRKAVYAYLGWLEWQLVEVLATALPDVDDATA